MLVKKQLSRMVVIFLTISMMMPFIAAQRVSADDLTIRAEMDTYVDNEGSYPEGFEDLGYLTDENFVGYDADYGEAKSAMKFQLASITDPIVSAELRIYITEVFDNTPPFVSLWKSSNDAWLENTATIPAAGDAIIEGVTGFVEGQWKTFDVTDYITEQAAGDKVATFVLTGRSSGDVSQIGYYSDEDNTYYPRLVVTVNSNEAPTDINLSSSSVAENAASGTAVGTLSAVDADVGDTFTYSLVSGAGSTDNVSFQIVGNELRTAAIFDYETKNSYSIRVRVTDGEGATYEEVLTITVLNGNDAPTDITLSSSSVAENQAVSTVVGNLGTADIDGGDTFTYSLVSGAGSTDNASFKIVGSQLQTNAMFDFETKSSYSVRVRTTDSASHTFEKAFTITITNGNDAPTNISLSGSTVAEDATGGFEIGTLTTTDLDGSDTFVYSLASGAGDTDNASFVIDGDKLKTNVATIFNYETKNSYSIRIRTTDSQSHTFEKQFTITVTNVNETPTDISLSAASIAENAASATPVGTFTATDVDGGDTFTYTLATGTGDADNSSFTIVGNELRSNEVFDYETKNSYSIRVRVTDAGGSSHEKVFTITITNGNDAPTAIALTANSLAENEATGTTIGTFSATDIDSSETFAYSLVSGAGDTGNASFTIDGNTLKSAVGFNFEAQDSYSIRVRVTDGGSNTFEQTFVISVTDVNEAPTDVSLTPSSFAENTEIGETIGAFIATDADAGDTFTYALVSGTGDTDNGSFSITNDELLADDEYDFENKSSYSIRVEVTDADGLTFEKSFVVTVTDSNDPPTNLTLTGDTVEENESAGTEVGTFATVDSDAGDTFTYTLVSGTGDEDNSSFAIASNKLNISTPLNYEAQEEYSIRVRVTDSGGSTFEKSFVITATDANDAPSDITLTGTEVDENESIGTVIGTLDAVDEDASNTFTYSLAAGSGDTDNASFAIVGNELRTDDDFNHETKDSYSIRIRVTDSASGTYEEIFTITIGDVNETPTGVSLSASSIVENQAIGTSIGSFTTTDVDDGDTFTYTFVSGSGDTDNASFTIAGNVLQTGTVLDYETKDSYSVRIRVTDSGGATFEQSFPITVTDGNDGPTDIALTNDTVQENQASGETVGSLSATDSDIGDSFTYALASGSGDTDNASFSITGDVLSTSAVFDYETKSSYSIRIQATDSASNIFEKTFVIAVTDVNDAPTGLSLSASSVAENAVSGTTVGTLNAADVDLGDTFTYTLVSGAGDTDNGSFTIAGNALKTDDVFDFETKDSYSVRIRVTDSEGATFEQAYVITVTDSNDAPTVLALTGATVAENEAAGTEIGTFSTTDVDSGDSFTYSLVSGTGDTDNTSFTISGDKLLTGAVLDYESAASHSIRVRVTDSGGGIFEKAFTITVTDANDAPSDLTLTGTTIAENTAVGTAVGTLTAADLDAGETFTYTLVSGTGDADNNSFTLAGNTLQSKEVFDFETKSSYSVRVRVTDAAAHTFEKAFTITVSNANEAPSNITLDVSSVAENAVIGTSVGALATTDADSGDSFTYSLVSGEGDTNNSSFTLADNVLKTSAVFDFETKKSYSVRIKATDAGGLSFEKSFTVTVTNVSEYSPIPVTPSLPVREELKLEIIVNGQRLDELADAEKLTGMDGRETITITLDEKKLEERLEKEGPNAVVQIPVNHDADIIIGKLNGQMVKTMENKDAVLKITTKQAEYTIPAEEIDIEALRGQFGADVPLQDIEVQVEIVTVSESDADVIFKKARNGNYQIIAPPVEYKITATHNGTTVEVTDFSAYIERTIAIPDDVDPDRITTGVVVMPDGTVVHMPTKVVEINGKRYAVIKSMTNSTYTIIFNEKKFSDVAGHWSEQAVNNMASRMIINGVSDESYEPDRSVTRAEFTAIITRALGLWKPQEGASFQDVGNTSWYHDAVSIAEHYGLVTGINDTTFAPDRTVTRQEAMVIIERALKLAGQSNTLTAQQIAGALQPFKDSAQVAGWARSSAALIIEKGIMTGFNSQLNPGNALTRAETAVIIKRLLEKAELI
ncbi:cadherin domain-containing protein [Paenibacillus oenotherae]|uniref:Cadherin domain-containing protein n=1 Tax=Paenibacillus oenotherae TaxID=1435645 RepID=A0ABS7D806_9BACL|nr:cadherin domain-containing protein [Paenibacillus oenotherae]MBW7476074.1 cadherin domain-containing protein [Paenibacillus oenotherae]